jgi:hypothetical protein
MSEFSQLFRESIGKKKNAYKVLAGKPEGKRHRWEDNIEMDLEAMR